jgi:hypothetical protein
MKKAVRYRPTPMADQRHHARYAVEVVTQFTKRLREPVMSGTVTCSVRIWRRPHVKVGGRYRFGLGAVEVTSIREINLSDITPASLDDGASLAS